MILFQCWRFIMKIISMITIIDNIILNICFMKQENMKKRKKIQNSQYWIIFILWYFWKTIFFKINNKWKNWKIIITHVFRENCWIMNCIEYFIVFLIYDKQQIYVQFILLIFFWNIFIKFFNSLDNTVVHNFIKILCRTKITFIVTFEFLDVFKKYS